MGNPSASGWHRTPPPQETCAAQELGSYLERMTSAAFDAAEADYDGPVIAIGRAAERYGVSFDGGTTTSS